jgi:putative transposase
LEYQRQRTKLQDVAYYLYLYFLGLFYRNTAKALQRFANGGHVYIWKWIQKYKPKMASNKSKKIHEFIIDETQNRVGSRYVRLWVAIGPTNRQILQIDISFERSMLVAERFIASLTDEFGRHPASTDGDRTWYPQACRFLKPKHHIHSPFEKSIVERKMQHIKDRTECFDDCFPCRRAKCNLHHFKNWLNLFAKMHSKKVMNA